MKVYEALYCPCIYESSYGTLSIHITKDGAEAAIQKHKDQIKTEHDDSNTDLEKMGLEKLVHAWDAHQKWSVRETELLG